MAGKREIFENCGRGCGPECDECKYTMLGAEIGAHVDRRQVEYGDAFGKCGDFLKILYPDGVKPEQYGDMLAIVRVFDKLMRVSNGGHGDGETPWPDIAGYALLGEMKARGRQE